MHVMFEEVAKVKTAPADSHILLLHSEAHWARSLKTVTRPWAGVGSSSSSSNKDTNNNNRSSNPRLTVWAHPGTVLKFEATKATWMPEPQRWTCQLRAKHAFLFVGCYDFCCPWTLKLKILGVILTAHSASASRTNSTKKNRTLKCPWIIVVLRVKQFSCHVPFFLHMFFLGSGSWILAPLLSKAIPGQHSAVELKEERLHQLHSWSPPAPQHGIQQSWWGC